jgi:protein-disulfide isomerase
MKHLLQNEWFTVTVALACFVLGFGISSSLGVQLSMGGVPSGGGAVAGNPPAPPAPPADAGKPATADDDMVLGKASAPVTIIEFSDMQCPYCRRFFTGAYPEIKKNYIETGKAKLVYRDFPLSFHPAALPSAMALECAADQSNDIAWALHDEIFKQQEAKGQGTVQYTADDIITWAKNVKGINTTTLKSCMDANKYDAEIKKDTSDGMAAGITGTPGFWILGPGGKSKKIGGAAPYATFKAAIDEVAGK